MWWSEVFFGGATGLGLATDVASTGADGGGLEEGADGGELGGRLEVLRYGGI